MKQKNLWGKARQVIRSLRNRRENQRKKGGEGEFFRISSGKNPVNLPVKNR